MQGLQEIWGIDDKEISWATSGYLGAINSGQTTCGLLIGSSIAIGLKTGQGKQCLPLEDTDERDKAVQTVNKLYHDFLKEFESTECQTLTTCDFSKDEELTRYVEKEIYKDCCFKFFNFVMNRFVEMDKKEAVLKGTIYNETHKPCATSTSIVSLYSPEALKNKGVIDES